MAEITLAEKFHLAEAANHMIRLYTLDAIWTEAAQRSDGVPAQSLPALRELVIAIDGALANAPDHAQIIENASARYENEVEAAYERLVTDERLASEHKDHWQRMVKDASGIGALILRTTRRIATMANDERDILTQQLQQIEAHNRVRGDVNQDVICGGLIGGAIAFGLCGIWLAALPAAALAGAYCGANNSLG